MGRKTTGVEETMITENVNGRSPVDAGSKQPDAKTGKVVNGKQVRVRKMPSQSSDVVTLLAAGETAEILERLPGWYKIQIPSKGITGYIASNYFQEVV